MKNSSLKSILLVFTVFIILFNCVDDDFVETINADSYTSLNELVQELKPITQTFNINPSITETVNGADGTTLTIYPNAFTDNDDNIITSPITVKLREHLSIKDMLLANAQTTSNGQLLVTGGSFNLNFEDENGNDVNVNPWNIDSQFQVRTNISGYENEMQYYVGDSINLDGREIVNWEFGIAEFGMIEGDFNIFGLDQGLSNCDVLYDMTGDTPTQFEVSITNVSNYSTANIWVVINDFPSIVSLNRSNEEMNALKTYDNSIPTGLNATLIAIVIDENSYLKFGTLPITVAGDETFNVDVDYGTTEELKALIQSIAN